MKYKLKAKIVTKPEIELPEGSKVVSVQHRNEYELTGIVKVPHQWQVVWLEPIEVE